MIGEAKHYLASSALLIETFITSFMSLIYELTGYEATGYFKIMYLTILPGKMISSRLTGMS
jgi:hypothetical protein